jgi:hypothetical protein
MNWESILSGFIAGGVGSFVTPMLGWGIEKRRIRHQRRADVIAAVRRYVTEGSFNFQSFSRTDHYLQVEEHLSEETKEMLSSKAIQVVVTDHGTYLPYQKAILKDLAALEKRWGLL